MVAIQIFPPTTKKEKKTNTTYFANNAHFCFGGRPGGTNQSNRKGFYKNVHNGDYKNATIFV